MFARVPSLLLVLVALVVGVVFQSACVSSERTTSAEERVERATRRWAMVQESPGEFTPDETLSAAREVASAFAELYAAREEDMGASAEMVATLGAAGGAGGWGLVALVSKLVGAFAKRRQETTRHGATTQGDPQGRDPGATARVA